jgi:hypothetical protein
LRKERHMFYFFATLSVALMIVFSLLYYTLKNGISPMPTSSKVRETLLKHFPEIEKGKIIDLGSGWGNLIFPLAKKFPSCQIIGYENSLIPYLFSFCLNTFSNLKIFRKSFFNASLHDADLIVCYLYSRGMDAVKKKLEQEMPPYAQVISHTFAIPGWEPTRVIEVDDLHRTKIYFYRRYTAKKS